jgi:hypothetical protein
MNVQVAAVEDLPKGRRRRGGRKQGRSMNYTHVGISSGFPPPGTEDSRRIE